MILVTGATGHIGNVLVAELYKRGHKDLRFFVAENDDISYVEPYAKEIVYGDIRDPFAVKRAVLGCDTVFHLAGLVKLSGIRNKNLFDINVNGTRNVVEACVEKEVRRLIYVSSVHALKEPPKGETMDECFSADIKGLTGAYARSKAMATIEVLNGIQKGLDAVIVFPSGIIGPYDYKNSHTGSAITGFIDAKKTQYYFDGAYDFVDVRDVADGLIRAWKFGEKGQGYIFSGSRMRLDEILDEVEANTGKKLKRRKVHVVLVKIGAIFAPFFYMIRGKRPMFSKYSVDVLMSNSNISNYKAREKLGYAPRPISETIHDLVTWLKRKRIKER
jgi:dihydroflavonol-4-reductase